MESTKAKVEEVKVSPRDTTVNPDTADKGKHPKTLSDLLDDMRVTSTDKEETKEVLVATDEKILT